MELIKKTISFSSLRNKETPLVYELLTKQFREKGCCTGLNNGTIVLQNAQDFDSNWGQLNYPYLNFKIFLTQNIDDMGIFTDAEYVDQNVSYQLLYNLYSGFTAPPPVNTIFGNSINDPYLHYFARFRGQTEVDFYASNGTITGLTDDKLFSVTSYITSQPLIQGLNFSNFPNDYFTGVDIGGIQSNFTAYTIDAFINPIDGTGLNYKTYNFNRLLYNTTVNSYFSIPYTTVSYKSQGWNSSNTSLSASVKEEIYFGIVFPQKIENNVFIERGVVSVFEQHSRLRYIPNIDRLSLYGNGFYNIVKS